MRMTTSNKHIFWWPLDWKWAKETVNFVHANAGWESTLTNVCYYKCYLILFLMGCVVEKWWSRIDFNSPVIFNKMTYFCIFFLLNWNWVLSCIYFKHLMKILREFDVRLKLTNIFRIYVSLSKKLLQKKAVIRKLIAHEKKWYHVLKLAILHYLVSGIPS